jgi:hypothetical protein
VVLVAGGQHASPIEWLHLFNRNPEVLLLEQLPVVQDVSLEPTRVAVGDGSMSLPSFESFFGQSSDILYYTPHVKMMFSPFLATCVGSLAAWEVALPCLQLWLPEILSLCFGY